MATYLLDTSILLGYLRSARYAEYVEKKYAPTKSPNAAVTSIVCIGELHSFEIRRKWGNERVAALHALKRQIPAVPIAHPSVVRLFAEIDAYRKGQHPRLLHSGPSIDMSHNDIWIAATASALKATLLTMDRDFTFLNGVLLDVVLIDQTLTADDA